MSWATKVQTGTRHSVTCSRAFAHRDPTCPRCKELANGAAPRAGWSDAKRQQEARDRLAIWNHFNVRDERGETGHERNTRTNGCDTAFEW